MDILILHISDLHIAESFNFAKKIESLCKVFSNELTTEKKAYLVITGDIANSGKITEYERANEVIDSIQKSISQLPDDIGFKIIVVPGNHDCNFELDSQIRKNCLQQIDYKMLGDDDSVMNTCLSVQNDFWSFYCKYNEEPPDKISYQVVDEINDKTICFHCHNTAWMSQRNEKSGSLFFPAKRFNTNKQIVHDLDISVFHHPINWFTPSSEINNKNEFQDFLDKTSTIHLVGHEHETSFKKTEDFDKKTNTTCFSGSILNNNARNEVSGFQILSINLSKRTGKFKRYIWEQNIYVLDSDNTFEYNKNNKRSFTLSNKYELYINDIGIPISSPEGINKLSDLFIFPDLESIDDIDDSIDNYIDSQTLIDSSVSNSYILEGDSQIGKSSLLRMIFLKSYNKGCYPILLEGKDFKNSDLDKTLKRIFRKIYITKKYDYDKYKQIDKENKILLIDNFHDIELSPTIIKQLLKQIDKYFNRTLITIDTERGMFPEVQADFSGFYNYTIKPLGYKKTNDLIVKYYSNGGKEYLRKQIFLDKVKTTFDQVRHVLGNKIIPSYPVFLLSILQSLEYASFDLNETSYGYCYQTLIHAALTKANIKNDDLGSYLNFIKELSYHFYTNGIETVSASDFQKFYNTYSDKFIIKPFDMVLNKLILSKVIIQDNSDYKFCYKYIMYFLVAKHISDIIATKKGKLIISDLFDNLHHEINANILVFITHHTNDLSFLNDSLFSAMIPFEKIQAITLHRGGPYYKHIKEISKEISNDIIDNDRTPEEEREKQLLSHDKNSRKLERETDAPLKHEEIKAITTPFLQAFRSIDIVGQIVKNRKGSLHKEEIIELISELYLTGFRTIGFLGTLFKDAKESITEELKERIKDSDSREEIDKKINSFFQMISMHTCLSVFTKLIQAVGIKDLKDIYIEVANRLGTPAAKLVSFSINSYYNDISITEVTKLAKEFKNNYVVLHILKSRVKSYIYTNHIDYRNKQRLAKALGMKISASIGREKNNL